MLISHKHQFIVFDIPKTCTLSMYLTLTKLNIIDVGGVMDSTDHFYQHASFTSCQKGFKKNNWDFNKYFSFTKVRNPWERYVSLMLYKINKAQTYEAAKNKDLKQWNSFRISQGEKCLKHWDAFNRNEVRFLEAIITNNPNQYSYICDENSEVNINLIGQLESIYKDFAIFCEEVGVLPIPDLKHSNKNTYEKPFTDYYNQKLIDMVAEKESWVIEKFGYNFS